MSVSLVGVTSGNTGAATSTSQSTSFHADWQADDVAVLFVGYGGTALSLNSGTAGWTAITGFTNPQEQGTNSTAYAYYRVLQGGDTAPVVGFSGSITGGWTMAIFRGADTSAPIGQAGAAEASSTTINIAALTGVLAGSMLWTAMYARVPSGTAVPTTWTPDADYTQPTDADHATSRNTATAQNLRFGGGYRAIASNGNYGGDTWTTNQTSSIISLHVEILAAATAQVIEIGQVVENNTAQVLSVNNPIEQPITQVVESDTAQSLAVNNPIHVEITQVVEAETAQDLAVVDIISAEIGRVTETNTAQTFTSVDPIHITIGQVTETDTAQTLTVDAGVPPVEPFVPSYDVLTSRWATSLLTTDTGSANVDPINLAAYIGQRQETYKFLLIDGVSGENLGEIHPLRNNTPTLTHDVSRTIKRSVSPLVLGVAETALINPITHRVLIYMLLGDLEFPLGRYMFASHVKIRSTGGILSSSTLVDEMFMVDQKIERSFAAGLVNSEQGAIYAVTPIPLAVDQLLENIDITYRMEQTPFFSLGSWPAGTNRGRILDVLAVDGDYLQPWFDHNGVLQFIRSFDPADAIPHVDWDASDLIIRDSISETNDVVNAPNRIIVISNSSSAADAAIVGTYDIPSSAPYSIDNRGFVVPEVIDLQVHTTAQANAVARNLGQRGMVFEQIDVATAPDPRHDGHTVARWQGQNWLELSWSLPLSAGSEMRHTLRKVYDD